MREIKFRAWDTWSDKMITEGGFIEIDGYGTPTVFDEKECEMGNVSEEACWDGDKDRFILMQYTGLLDKNGKEIFEGDIVKSDKGVTGYVEYVDEDAMYWFLGLGEQKRYKDYLDLYWNDKLEIISNVWENPKLIT